MNKEKYKLNPNWVTGFTDAEGCFYVGLTKNNNCKTGWRVRARFQIKLHIKDMDLLLQIKNFFNNIGYIYKNNNNIIYQIISTNDITNTIIPHFDKYPLLTQKKSDFLNFKNIVELMNKGEHLNKSGLTKIINLKASLNNGLSKNLINCFPNIIKMERAKVNIPDNINYYWIAGFFSGEGSFFIDINKSIKHKNGYSIQLRISISQHIRDEVLITKLSEFLKCGFVTKHSDKAIVLIISKFNKIYYNMIPMFNKYSIKGIKSLDYKDFCKIAEIIKNKYHLTLEGLEKIRKIKSNMNSNRKNVKKNIYSE